MHGVNERQKVNRQIGGICGAPGHMQRLIRPKRQNLTSHRLGPVMHKPGHRQAALYAVHRGWQMPKILATTGCHLEGQQILFCIPDYMDLG